MNSCDSMYVNDIGAKSYCYLTLGHSGEHKAVNHCRWAAGRCPNTDGSSPCVKPAGHDGCHERRDGCTWFSKVLEDHGFGTYFPGGTYAPKTDNPAGRRCTFCGDQAESVDTSSVVWCPVCGTLSTKCKSRTPAWTWSTDRKPVASIDATKLARREVAKQIHADASKLAACLDGRLPAWPERARRIAELAKVVCRLAAENCGQLTDDKACP